MLGTELWYRDHVRGQCEGLPGERAHGHGPHGGAGRHLCEPRGQGFCVDAGDRWNAVVLTLNPGNFSRGTLAIYDRTGTVEFSSPTHEFWGGEFWACAGPW